MILVDANLLLYANDPSSAHRDGSRAWLASVLAGSELVRFAWLSLWAFLRISTNPRVFQDPLAMAVAEDIVLTWLAQPAAAILEPGERHWEILRQLLQVGQATGPLVTDAALAALAIEHGATLYTTDRDFARFPGLKWQNPLAADNPTR